jgi:membrane protein required for colicin V production
MMHWYWLDVVILSVIGLSMITGLFRGFVKELMAICIWGSAFTLAAIYTTEMSFMLQPLIHEATVRKIVAFVLILLITLLLGGLCNALLSFVLNRTGLHGTDRVLGMGFGFIRGVFIVALIILVIEMTSIPYQSYAQNSWVSKQFNPLVAWMHRFLPNFLAQVKTIEPKMDRIVEL